MTITGTHALLHTSEPDAVRAIFRDVLGWHNVDAHEGWLIFALPPAELGIHPTMQGEQPHHELSFMCDDINSTVTELRAKGIDIPNEPQNAGFGVIATMKLPGGLDVLLYEPRHPTAI